MPFYTQTLDDIPKEFMKNHKSGAQTQMPEPGMPINNEDLMFILALLLFLQDEPYFSALD